MRATTTILFIAGFIGAAFAADTKQFSDENCENEIKDSRKGFGGLSTGDIAILGETKSIEVDSVFDSWFAFQDNDGGDNCRGDLITELKEGDCIRVTTLGIGCTRLCGAGLGGGACASNEEPL